MFLLPFLRWEVLDTLQCLGHEGRGCRGLLGSAVSVSEAQGGGLVGRSASLCNVWLARELPVCLLGDACGRLLQRLLGFPKWLLKPKAGPWDEVLVLVLWRAGLQLCQSISDSFASAPVAPGGFLQHQVLKYH